MHYGFYILCGVAILLIVYLSSSSCKCKEGFSFTKNANKNMNKDEDGSMNKSRELPLDEQKIYHYHSLQEKDKILQVDEVKERIKDSENSVLYSHVDFARLDNGTYSPSGGEIDFLPHVSYFGSNGSRGGKLPSNHQDCEETFQYCGMMTKQNEYALSRCQTSRRICHKLVEAKNAYSSESMRT